MLSVVRRVFQPSSDFTVSGRGGQWGKNQNAEYSLERRWMESVTDLYDQLHAQEGRNLYIHIVKLHKLWQIKFFPYPSHNKTAITHYRKERGKVVSQFHVFINIITMSSNSKQPIGTPEFTLSYLDNTNTCYHELVAISLKEALTLQNGEFIPNFVPNSRRARFWYLTFTLKT